MLQSVIGQIGIFMICAQALLQFRPKETYGKYLRLLLSAMILLQVVQPISGLFFGGSEQALQNSMEQFQSSMEESMEQAALRALEAEKQLEERSMLEVQERLAEQETATGDKAVDEKQSIEIAPVEKIQITREEENE